MPQLIGRDEGAIRNQIVHERRAQRAGIPEKGHLNGRGARCEDPRPGVTRVSSEIDGNVEFHLPGEPCDLLSG